ncbi:MAG: hypothetical protein A3H59_01660 [Candidatus Jacksonbacteria bacterium RIFCSPLOWO2_02_FULL_43_9]|nr:MAG: hypothetical protein UV70_C0002G0041 [Parcubacteria group bacterium GW2011_GWA2_43_13]OGY69198.1 MAG: hypothetical protein A3B94_01420 [Candidatus Jacksonbacteria bacterium RIFCSPHIGHO2_02_FULL_43_10]OGY70513.1 MAG: hypothetical protein A2986_02190 [Candidatus Jacksonbacteria bacterium RIFCSPLOWO2_01_FULL_44_13]OGY72851.1 MAG: hypothetical protein A3H59_01660 [Candidatus Jacksonbacteria bacterium RIFCSPLOWO2_02_FULL_43_9]HAZ16449.1 hypothetical protein [Candidatus Jacksonbacteria bacter
MDQQKDSGIQEFIDGVCHDIGIDVLPADQQEALRQIITQDLNAFVGERVFFSLSTDKRSELEKIIRDGGQDQLDEFFASATVDLSAILQQSFELFSMKWRQEAADMIASVS